MVNLTEDQIKILNSLIELAQYFAAVGLKDYDRTLNVVIDRLASEGWTVPPALSIDAIKTIGQTEKIDDINEFLKWYFSQNNYKAMQQTAESILSSNIKNGLKKMVKECWIAFQSGLYALCSTGLLSVIEGVLSEFSEDKQDVRMMNVCQKIVDTLPKESRFLEKQEWISYNKFIRNLYQKSDFNANEPNAVNRHWLLHGRSDFEIDELDCIRLFNAVASLCMIVSISNDISTLKEE